MAEGFGIEKKASPFEEYIGKYVIIYPMHQISFAGKLERIEPEFLVLNPFLSHKYAEERVFNRIQSGDLKISKEHILSIHPTSRKNLEDYCIYQNKEAEKSKGASNNKPA